MRSKRPAPMNLGDDIVCSCGQPQEVQRKRLYRNTRNSTYGAMLSPHFGLGRKEMGASVTACGRAITKHMIETIAHKLLGYKCEITWYFGEERGNLSGYKRTICLDPKTQDVCAVTLLSDTDSVVGSTLIQTPEGTKPIEDLFNESLEVVLDNRGREFGSGDNRLALGYNGDSAMMPIRQVYRHKTKKKLYRITTETGRSITITEDHSLMVRRNGTLMEMKPTDVHTDTDICIGEVNEVS